MCGVVSASGKPYFEHLYAGDKALRMYNLLPLEDQSQNSMRLNWLFRILHISKFLITYEALIYL